MELNIFAFAVPLFLFFIGLEYYIALRKGRKDIYKFNSSIANLNVGIAERLIDLFTAGGFYFFYDYLHKNYALFQIQPSVIAWIVLLLLTDFLWYWYHRFGHEINIFWGFHVVHHSSDEFNYTAATRITIFQAVLRTFFWAFIPIIGFPAHMISIVLIIHGVYPFFTHTQLVGKLGILEYLFVTPTHHGVHHASNECYLDKNYGDMFIIWDKLFGTFAAETEPTKYGLTKSLESKSFLWQHFHFLAEIFYVVVRTPGVFNKLKVIFGQPKNFDPNAREKVENIYLSKKRVSGNSLKFRKYVVWQMIFMLTILFLLLLFEKNISTSYQFLIAAIIVITLINCGAILEQRRWVTHVESIRAVLIFIPFIIHWPLISVYIFMIICLFVINIDVDIINFMKYRYYKDIYGINENIDF